jgi:hypothetical protein
MPGSARAAESACAVPKTEVNVPMMDTSKTPVESVCNDIPVFSSLEALLK